MKNKCFIQCSVCGNLESIPASLEKVKDWSENRKNRPLIQDVFAELNDVQRELILSKTCDTCFTKMWGEE